MNRITKSPNVPTTLLERGEEEVKRLRNLLEAHQDLDFKKNIYAAPDVKQCLRKDQYGKCAYCERFFNGDYGAVEHFRPKGGYQIEGEKKIRKPGYYWLAYDWSNLLYSCSECNTTFKRNFFPLADETKRDISHENIKDEQPLLLNPTVDDLDDMIEYHEYMIVPKEGGSSREKVEKTISLFQLNDRGVLKERRKMIWNQYARLCKTYSAAKFLGLQEMVGDLEKMIQEMVSEQSEFTGMFKYQRK